MILEVTFIFENIYRNKKLHITTSSFPGNSSPGDFVSFKNHRAKKRNKETKKLFSYVLHCFCTSFPSTFETKMTITFEPYIRFEWGKNQGNALFNQMKISN